jgi:hypothetical protein
MTNRMLTRSLGRVSAPMPAKSSSSQQVRVTSRVVSELEELPADQAASAARAIERIGKEEGLPFEPPDGSAGERYMVMVPDHDEAPVVVYRQDENGYLVTGLTKRADFNTYVRPEPSGGFLDSPVGQAALIAGGAALILWLRSRSKTGGGASSAETQTGAADGSAAPDA